jgi:hypothetical protein
MAAMSVLQSQFSCTKNLLNSKIYCCYTQELENRRLLNIHSIHSGSSVSTVSNYGLNGWGSIPDRSKDFSSSLCVHPGSYAVGTGGSFAGGKARPGRDAEHYPTSSAEVKKE